MPDLPQTQKEVIENLQDLVKQKGHLLVAAETLLSGSFLQEWASGNSPTLQLAYLNSIATSVGKKIVWRLEDL